MFTERINPRFLETDALGHINNNTNGVWFEAARDPFFRLFIPTLDVKEWNLIIAHSSYDFVAELYFGKEVVIKTAIEKIGNSSVTLIHAAYQSGKLCTIGKAVMIYFDHHNKKSMPIPTPLRAELEKHIFETPWPFDITKLD